MVRKGIERKNVVPLHLENVPRIEYILSTLKESGPVNQVYETIRYLDRGRFEPEIITLSPEPPGTRRQDFERMGVTVNPLNLSRMGGAFFGPSKFKKILDNRQPDMLHSHGLRPDVFASFFSGDIPTVSTIHNVPNSDYPLKYGDFRGTAIAVAHQRSLTGIDTPVACSRSVSKELSTLSCTTIRNGINRKNYSPSSPDERTRMRKKLDLPMETNLFIHVGSFIERKRPKEVIRGFLSSSAANQGTLLMIGDGPLRDECVEITDGSPSVLLPGYVDSVEPYLRSADYYVSGASAEGLPLGVLEAMGCGLPVCLSDIGPHQEILGMNDSMGVIFSGEDVESIAGAFDRIQQPDYETMANASRNVVESTLNSQRMSNEYQNLYMNALENSKS